MVWLFVACILLLLIIYDDKFPNSSTLAFTHVQNAPTNSMNFRWHSDEFFQLRVFFLSFSLSSSLFLLKPVLSMWWSIDNWHSLLLFHPSPKICFSQILEFNEFSKSQLWNDCTFCMLMPIIMHLSDSYLKCFDKSEQQIWLRDTNRLEAN